MIATHARIVTPASALAVLLLAAPLAIEAQQAKHIPRIGFLASSSTERDKSRLAAFRQGLRGLGDALFGLHRERIVALAAKSRLPALYPARHFVDSGGLMSYGTNFDDLFRRAAAYVVKILKGATPADLPIQQPTTFELIISLKTAKALGLRIPPSVLLRADEVIQ
jgi:putative ABC transport system substrate-binding protein